MKGSVKPAWCRHCARLLAGTCPYPGASSIHRMQLSAAGCELAVLHPAYRALYTTNIINRIRVTGTGQSGHRVKPALSKRSAAWRQEA